MIIGHYSTNIGSSLTHNVFNHPASGANLHSINHHLMSIRVALEALPALGYELHDDLKQFLQLDTNERNHALNLHQALNFYRTLMRCYPGPRLALDIAQAFPPQVYGMFGFGMMVSATGRESLKFAVRFQRLAYTLMTITANFGDNTSSLCFNHSNLNIDSKLAAFFADRDLAASQVSFKAPQQINSIPETVTLVHDGFGVPELYREHFGCEVQFNAPIASLVYRSEDLDLPSLYRNQEAFDICQRECEKQLAAISHETDIAGQVSNELSIRPGYLQDIESIANQLNLSTRTLRRRLAETNLSFQQLQQNVRYDQAKQYLQRNRLSIAEVSILLGFSEPGNFTQAFKRWSNGLSPRQFRQQADNRLE